MGLKWESSLRFRFPPYCKEIAKIVMAKLMIFNVRAFDKSGARLVR